MTTKRSRSIVTTLVLGACLATAGPALATLQMQKQAKEKGFAAANCQFCHADKLPKKGAAAHNDRGKWLVDQKEKRHAKEVDVSWLKDYAGKK